MTGAMLGFPGEDYSTPQAIEKTAASAIPPPDPERLRRLQWALQRTLDLGLADLMMHAGFIPAPGDPARKAFLDTLGAASALAQARGVTLAFETGQETADLLRLTLDELACPNLKVNFDPANMLLYDKAIPCGRWRSSAPTSAASTSRTPGVPPLPGDVGRGGAARPGAGGHQGVPGGAEESGLRPGRSASSARPGDQQARLRDVAHGIRHIRECLA